ncbi:MAG: glycosyltransferase family 4 protein [Pseudomonadota bacterium]
MSQILVVSKPFAPPWRDSSKNLARELVRAATATRFRVLTPPGLRLPFDHVVTEGVYRHAGRFEPGLLQNLRVLARLLQPAQADLIHFFFAPSARTARAARLALSLPGRRLPTVQTVCSLPVDGLAVRPGLFADATVVLSRYAQQRLLAEGVAGVHCIAPAVRAAPWPSPRRRQRLRRLLGLVDGPVVLFAGDLEPARGAATLIEAVPALRAALPDIQVVIAARAKTPATRVHARELNDRVNRLGAASCVRFVGEVRHMRAWLAAADVQVLVARSLEKKMDYPLVLLEGLARGLPVVVSDRPPLSEILELAPGAGRRVAPDDPEALAHAVATLLDDSTALDAARHAAHRGVRAFSPALMAERYVDLYRSLLPA